MGVITLLVVAEEETLVLPVTLVAIVAVDCWLGEFGSTCQAGCGLFPSCGSFPTSVLRYGCSLPPRVRVSGG